MDVTGLSVSIDVDMSSFIEAMEKLTALIMATVDQVNALEESFKNSANGIKETGDTVGTVIELIGDAVDIIKDLSEIAEGDEFALVSLFKDAAKAAWDVKKAFDETSGSIDKNAASINKHNTAVKNNVQSLNVQKKTQQDTGIGEGHFPDFYTTNDGQKVYFKKPKESQTGTDKYQGLIPDAGALPILGNSESYPNSSYIDTIMGKSNVLKGIDVGDMLKHLTPNVADATAAQPTNPALPPPVQQPKFDFMEDYKKRLAEVQKAMGKFNADIKVNVTALSATQGQYTIVNQSVQQNINNINGLTGAINKETEANKKAADAAKKHADAMKQAGEDIGGAFNAMGEAMAKGKDPGKAFLQSMLGTLSSFLAAKGAAMIGAGIGESIALQPMGPLDLAGGAALEVAAGALKAVKLAAGGIVSGSSFVNVGEYTGASHNPEVIAPLDKLRNMMGGGTQNHTFEIHGDKLVSILQRVDNNNSFALGGQ